MFRLRKWPKFSVVRCDTWVILRLVLCRWRHYSPQTDLCILEELRGLTIAWALASAPASPEPPQRSSIPGNRTWATSPPEGITLKKGSKMAFSSKIHCWAWLSAGFSLLWFGVIQLIISKWSCSSWSPPLLHKGCRQTSCYWPQWKQAQTWLRSFCPYFRPWRQCDFRTSSQGVYEGWLFSYSYQGYFSAETHQATHNWTKTCETYFMLAPDKPKVCIVHLL